MTYATVWVALGWGTGHATRHTECDVVDLALDLDGGVRALVDVDNLLGGRVIDHNFLVAIMPLLKAITTGQSNT